MSRTLRSSVAGVAVGGVLLTGLLASSTVVNVPRASADPDAVAAAQAQMTEITKQSDQIEKAYKDSADRLKQAQDAYQLAQADLATQTTKVATMQAALGQIATISYRNSGVSDVAKLLTSPDDSHFLADMGTISSVAALTDERLARFTSEKEHLQALQLQAATSLAKIDAETQEQKQLLEQSEKKKAEVKALLDKLTAEEAERLKQLQEQTSRVAGQLAAQDTTSRSIDTTQLAAAIQDGKIWPTSGPITSPFGYRVNPIGGYSEFHDGDDIAPPCGTPVMAAWSGVVTFAGVQSGWGNRVEIKHANGMSTSYNHLQGFSVSVGQQVSVGEVIARVGTTGYSTGCHLHFSVYQNGKQIDPAATFGVSG